MDCLCIHLVYQKSKGTYQWQIQVVSELPLSAQIRDRSVLCSGAGGGGQRDLRFCKNERSKKSNNNEKGGQQARKLRRKFEQITSKVSNKKIDHI